MRAGPQTSPKKTDPKSEATCACQFIMCDIKLHARG